MWLIHSVWQWQWAVLTDRCAAVQVPQVVQFISQFDQFGLPAAVRRVFHLLALPLLFGQALIVRHLLNDTSHDRPELCFKLCRRSVCVLHCVVKQSSLQHKVNTHTHTVCNLQTLYLMVLPNRYSLITYLQDLDVCDASFMAENSCYSLKAHTQSCEHQREERLIVPAAGTKLRIVHKIFNIVINTTEEVCHIIYLLESLFFVYRVFSTTQRTSETLFSTDTIKETCCAFSPFCQCFIVVVVRLKDLKS